jgi:glycine dehydrogenase subunit 1
MNKENSEALIHPYIPNSVPRIKAEMMRAIGVDNVEDLYGEMIPRRLLLDRSMDLPEALPSEYDLRQHVKQRLMRDSDTVEYVSFLGAGCWRHYVPEVCNVIASRSEFLTAYAGGVHSDLGRYQANFEFQSLICGLLDMEVSGIPTYDWGAAAGNSVRMATRITGRREVLIPKNIGPARLSVIRNFCGSATDSGEIKIKMIDYDRDTGMVDLNFLEREISEKVACVYFENPNFLGVIESEAQEISDIVHRHGAESVCGVDPITLGVLSPPAEYGVDIACGEAQPLGIHMNGGGGSCGFIASRDEEKYVAEYPLRLICITETEEDDEYGFGQAAYERTSYMARENAKDWVGTTTALWGITAAVYLSLLGPRGMRELGETILQKSHYAAKIIEEIPGVEVPYKIFFKEFPVIFDKPVEKVNQALRNHKIFGGKDLSKDFPELGDSALYCVTEVHSLAQIEALGEALREALS